MRAFLIHDEGHPMLVAALEQQLLGFLSELGVSAKTDWYWDDNPETGTEYGVWFELPGLAPWTFTEVARIVFRHFASIYGDLVRVEVNT